MLATTIARNTFLSTMNPETKKAMFSWKSAKILIFYTYVNQFNLFLKVVITN